MSNITITVSSAAELKAALSTASGGELILLNSGDYGNLSLKSNSGFDITFPSNVTIASANPAAPASFSGLDVNGAENLTFDGINFDYQFQSGDQLWTTPFSVENARNITITNSTFDGDEAWGLTAADNGYGIGIGFGVYDSANITLTNNDISTFHRGIVVTRSSNTVVAGNEVHDIRSDGMNFIEVDTVLIENNYIHDFRASPTSDDHVDMIQFWTAGTNNPSENITIRGNILDIGQGNWTQSIFMGNEAVSAGAGANMFYQNVVIENNTIYNSHLHGISVFAANGLEIGNNTLVQVLDQDGSQSDNPTLWTPRINVGGNSVNVSITGSSADNGIYSSASNDSLSGLAGNDTIDGGAGNDTIDGGAGIDMAAYTGNQSNYKLTLGQSSALIADRRSDGDGTDTLISIEKLTFDDRTLDLDNYSSLTQLNEAQFSDLAKVYVAYFNRAADAEGLYFWADKLAEGMDMATIANYFSQSAEAKALYPNTADTSAFVTAVYANVLGRTPDAAGFEFWTANLNNGSVQPAAFVLNIIGGAQGADITYLSSKAALGVYFSAIKGMSDVADAQNVLDIFGDQATSNTAGAKASVDDHFTDATASGSGEFIFELIGIVNDPFAGVI